MPQKILDVGLGQFGICAFQRGAGHAAADSDVGQNSESGIYVGYGFAGGAGGGGGHFQRFAQVGQGLCGSVGGGHEDVDDVACFRGIDAQRAHGVRGDFGCDGKFCPGGAGKIHHRLDRVLDLVGIKTHTSQGCHAAGHLCRGEARFAAELFCRLGQGFELFSGGAGDGSGQAHLIIESGKSIDHGSERRCEQWSQHDDF